MTDQADRDIPPDILMALGHITISSGTLDMNLCVLFQWLLDAPEGRAARLYYSAPDMTARLEMLRAVLSGTDTDEPTRRRVNDLADRAQDLGDRRDEYLRSLWSVCADGTIVLMSHEGSRQSRSIEDEEVEALARDFQDLLDDHVVFINDVGASPVSWGSASSLRAN